MTGGEERGANRLIHETSPYLLQHAHNPVDWYPWGREALDRARGEDRPILLSIGYAACHWCHVMERESFEDPATAALMNDRFVNVKVDREERPDLDGIYMDAVQALTGSGGWPMTVFVTPDGAPFFAGTYFPKEDMHGLPAFTKVLAAISDVWRDRRDDVESQARQVLGTLASATRLTESREPLGRDVTDDAAAGIRRTFDPEWGGFGGAPKFPQPMTLEFLLRRHLGGDPEALPVVRRTLDRMAAGGMYDHVGGGFHRYSVDGRWHVPHFEKMLSDNALLARLYGRAWQVTGEPRYARVASDTLAYLVREMRHPEGGFFSSQDADSEGAEGTFYVWRWNELVESLSASVRATGAGIPPEVAAGALGALPEGNWEGRNVLWMPRTVEAVAVSAGVDPDVLSRLLDDALPRLRGVRAERVPPGTDDKVLAAWNGLAIGALAEWGRARGEPALVEAARDAADFVLLRLRDGDGRLLRSWREGRPGRPGFADDHALLADGLLALYETTFELRWFEEARRLADDLLRLFRDPERGGFFQTGEDAEALVVRPKDLYDNAVPSGNSAAAEVLLRVARLTGEPEYERAAASALRLVHEAMRRAPLGFGHALCALDRYLSGGREVALIGEAGAPDLAALQRVLNERYLPDVVRAGAGPDDAAAAAAVALLADRSTVGGSATAYVCRGFVCDLPITDPAELGARLDS